MWRFESYRGSHKSLITFYLRHDRAEQLREATEKKLDAAFRAAIK
jgi:hypothetical protein